MSILDKFIATHSKDRSLLLISIAIIGIHLCFIVWAIFDNPKIKQQPQSKIQRLVVQTIELHSKNQLKLELVDKLVVESQPILNEPIPIELEALPIESFPPSEPLEVINNLQPDEEPLPRDIAIKKEATPPPTIEKLEVTPEIKSPEEIQEIKPSNTSIKKVDPQKQKKQRELKKDEAKITEKQSAKLGLKSKEKISPDQKLFPGESKSKTQEFKTSSIQSKKETAKNKPEKTEPLKNSEKQSAKTLTPEKKTQKNRPSEEKTKEKNKKEREEKATIELHRKKEAEEKALKAQQKSLSEAQERIAKIISSSDKLSQVKNISDTLSASPASISKLQVDDLLTSDIPQLNDRELCYRYELKNRLELLLRLPKDEIVKIKLTIERSGKVAKVVVVSAKSEANQAYIEDKLPKMTFPSYQDMFRNAPQYTFPITIND